MWLYHSLCRSVFLSSVKSPNLYWLLSIILSTLLFLPVFCMLLKLTNWKLRFFSSQYDNRWTWIEPGISDESWEQWTLTNCSFIAITFGKHSLFLTYKCIKRKRIEIKTTNFAISKMFSLALASINKINDMLRHSEV